jgi:uroporphyrinogen decarboxylase
MPEMTTHERMERMFAHQEADRVPVIDAPWAATIERWQREGLPEGMSYVDYFDLDRFHRIHVDNTPRYPEEVVEETDAYTIVKTDWGATLKRWKHAGGVPEFLDFTITDRQSWEEAKARMTPAPDRVDWGALERNYADWRREGAWIEAGGWFGFDVLHSWAVGTTRVLMAMLEDPAWISDMMHHWLELDLALFDLVWERGYYFDALRWPDDMGYKGHQFFSLDTYRELVKPVHQRAAEWAHEHGVVVELHSCGNIMPFVPDLVDAGIDMLNPLEVKAGMDPIQLKQTYGDELAFHGGLNAVLYTEPDELWAEMQRVIPVMKAQGGYVISSDHSVPESVSLETFGQFVNLAKGLGSYA